MEDVRNVHLAFSLTEITNETLNPEI